jgi:hypothetical protein
MNRSVRCLVNPWVATAFLIAGGVFFGVRSLVAGPPVPPRAREVVKPTTGDQERTLDGRIKELIAVLASPDACSEGIENTRRAIAELVRIGSPAVPVLVKTVVGVAPVRDDSLNGASYSALALDRMGPAALPGVLAAWDGLGEADRWKLMPFRGRHDAAAATEYALPSLQSESEEAVRRAVSHLGEFKVAEARQPLLRLLNGAKPRLRWAVVEALTKVGGEEVEDAFIRLLAPTSWAARGVGQPPPLGAVPPWWPDGRPHIVKALHALKSSDT